MNKQTEQKIINSVKEYKKLFPVEYKRFQKQIKMIRYDLKTPLAEVKGSDTIYREVYRIPENLWNLFKIKLNDEESQWFQSQKGQKWFATKFPEFRVTSKY